MYAYVCMCVCVYIYMYICVHMCVCVCTHAHAYVHVYTIHVCVCHLTFRIEDGPEKDKGVKCGDVEISYWMIQQDVRRTVDWVHNEVSSDI